MKKVSTTAAKQAKNFREHKLTIGLDLGDRSSWYCVTDQKVFTRALPVGGVYLGPCD